VAFNYRNSSGAQAIWTTEFTPIAPPAGGVDIVWNQIEDALIAGSTLDIHPAVMVGGQWYASERAFTTNDVQTAWQRSVLFYTTTAANWRTLTLGTGNATIGAAPGTNLSGSISGLGLVSVANSIPTGSTAAWNEAVWYDYIAIVPHVVPGDVNGVGGATLDDYNIIRANFRTNVTSRAQGDLNADGFVDVLDFREWKANVPPAVAAGVTIPEPGSCALAAAGVACLWLRGRRRCR
jgi:hypothetical protein